MFLFPTYRLAIILSLFLLVSIPLAQADTLYIDRSNPAASDSNPGTLALPFLTLAKMTAMIKTRNDAGTPVVMMVGPGTYRENLSLTTTGTETTAAITIQAMTFGTVKVDGADVWTGWTKQAYTAAYTHAWPYTWGLAPYPSQYWIDNTFLAPIVRRREMIFVNGIALDQVLEASSLTERSFFVDETAAIVYIIPPSGTNMTTATVEVAVRSSICKIESKTNIAIKGLIFQHDNSPVSESAAAVTIDTVTNALLEDNQIIWNNWTGLSMFTLTAPTFRRNIVSYNGAVGMDSWRVTTLLMEDNDTSYNNWRGVRGGFTGWTTAGMKHLFVHGGTITRHRSVGNNAVGIWFDTDIMNITMQDSFSGNNLSDGTFIEAVQGPITVTNTAFCGNKSNGVLVANARAVTFTNNVVSGNLGRQVEISGDDTPRGFNNWQTGVPQSVLSDNWTFTGNKILSLQSGGFLIHTILSTSWANFISTLTSNTNTWFNPKSTNVFGVNGGTILDFAGWKTTTGKDTTGSTFTDIQPPCAS